MGIIEREIEKRKAIVDSKAEKEARVAELREEADALEVEASQIDVATLIAEIEELATYLPQPETEEVVEG